MSGYLMMEIKNLLLKYPNCLEVKYGTFKGICFVFKARKEMVANSISRTPSYYRYCDHLF